MTPEAEEHACVAANGRTRLDPVAAPYDVEHDLVGPGADPVQAHVAPDALDPVLAHVAGPAVDLDALVGDLDGDARGVQLGHRDLAHRVLAVGEAPGGRVHELAGGLDLGRHLGELVPGHLEPAAPPAPRGAPRRGAARARGGRGGGHLVSGAGPGPPPRSPRRRSAARPGAPT